MANMLEAMVVALATLFSWPVIAFAVVGTILGVTFGALPGLGGPIAFALLIPVTFGLDPGPAMVLFGSTLGGVAFGGSISAILLNAPGTAMNAATMFDGHPLSKQGRAAEALGISATASALGALFGLVILVLLIPIAERILLAFAPPEFFWLAIFGLTVIGVVSQGNLQKGMISGGIGLIISFIGFVDVSGAYRYGFGTDYLWSGIPLIPALIGIFALAEVISLASSGGTIANQDTVATGGDVLTGVKSVFKYPRLFLQSSLIGTFVGMIPGAGAAVATFIAYMQAVQISDSPETFGSGNIEGIIASEASNDAKDGGALLPTVIFGVPGSPVMAVLLGAFILHGLEPGSQMVNENLHILFVIIFSLLLSNILTSTFGLATAGQLVKVTQVPVKLLIPAIIIVSLAGSFAIRNNVIDVGVTIVFGVLGFAMVALNYSRVAVILALILGPLAERSFHLSLDMSRAGYMIFVTRPISLLLIGATILSILYPIIRRRGDEEGITI